MSITTLTNTVRIDSRDAASERRARRDARTRRRATSRVTLGLRDDAMTTARGADAARGRAARDARAAGKNYCGRGDGRWATATANRGRARGWNARLTTEGTATRRRCPRSR